MATRMGSRWIFLYEGAWLMQTLSFNFTAPMPYMWLVFGLEIRTTSHCHALVQRWGLGWTRMGEHWTSAHCRDIGRNDVLNIIINFLAVILPGDAASGGISWTTNKRS